MVAPPLLVHMKAEINEDRGTNPTEWSPAKVVGDAGSLGPHNCNCGIDCQELLALSEMLVVANRQANHKSCVLRAQASHLRDVVAAHQTQISELISELNYSKQATDVLQEEMRGLEMAGCYVPAQHDCELLEIVDALSSVFCKGSNADWGGEKKSDLRTQLLALLSQLVTINKQAAASNNVLRAEISQLHQIVAAHEARTSDLIAEVARSKKAAYSLQQKMRGLQTTSFHIARSQQDCEVLEILDKLSSMLCDGAEEDVFTAVEKSEAVVAVAAPRRQAPKRPRTGWDGAGGPGAGGPTGALHLHGRGPVRWLLPAW